MIVVSACLAGVECRYNGTAFPCDEILELVGSGQAISVCPEVLGGLPVPRPPVEICDGRIMTQSGQDITNEYWRGALAALRIALVAGCDTAILKARSPSCGSGQVYDGGFSGSLVKGDGIFSSLLKQSGIIVYTDEEYRSELESRVEINHEDRRTHS